MKTGMKIVILDGFTENPGDLSWDGLRACGDLTVYDRTPADLTAQRMQGAEAVFTNKTIISAEIMEKCPALKFIGVLATGVNIVESWYPTYRPTVRLPWLSLPWRFCWSCAIMWAPIPRR